MITCKEDLIDKYVDKNDKEAFELWWSFVVDVAESENKKKTWFTNRYACLQRWSNGDLYVNSISGVWLKGKEQIFTSDFKPQKPTRTKVEYVKVTESIFDLKDEFERGELHYTFGDEEWFVFNDEPSLLDGFKEKNIYRRIETPITERDEFIEKVGDILPVFDKRTNPMWAGKLYDAGCRFMEE